MRRCALWVCGVGIAAATDIESLTLRLDKLGSTVSSLTADNKALQEQVAALRAAAPGEPLAGELRVFESDACPTGWREFAGTQGYLLTGRPKGGSTGTQINRALEAGEAARAAPHSHTATVTDSGHTHTAAVDDKGHSHTVDESAPDDVMNVEMLSGGGRELPIRTADCEAKPGGPATAGIAVTNQPAQAGVQVGVQANEGGEGYPLAYVLVCQREGGGASTSSVDLDV
jgi:hypothetical protein